MSIVETPPLLILGTEQEYITRVQTEYGNQTISTPEGVEVVFYLNNNHQCRHLLSGGGKNGKFNPFRAHRILWVKFLLENNAARITKQSTANGNIIFLCKDLCYVVVCSLLPNGKLKFITQYIKTTKDMLLFDDPLKYTNYTLTAPIAQVVAVSATP